MNEPAKSSHPLFIDETLRTRDELAEILTLTGASRRIPVLLVQRGFWDGIIHWFRATGCARVPSTRPLELFAVVDNPREVVDAIFKCYEHRGLGLSAEGQEILLHL